MLAQGEHDKNRLAGILPPNRDEALFAGHRVADVRRDERRWRTNEHSLHLRERQVVFASVR